MPISPVRKDQPISASHYNLLVDAINAMETKRADIDLQEMPDNRASYNTIEARIIEVKDGVEGDQVNTPRLLVHLYDTLTSCDEEQEVTGYQDQDSFEYAAAGVLRVENSLSNEGDEVTAVYPSPQCLNRLATPTEEGTLDRDVDSVGHWDPWRCMLSEVFEPEQRIRVYIIGDVYYFDLPEVVIIPCRVETSQETQDANKNFTDKGKYLLTAMKRRITEDPTQVLFYQDNQFEDIGSITGYNLDLHGTVPYDEIVWLRLDPYRNFFDKPSGFWAKIVSSQEYQDRNDDGVPTGATSASKYLYVVTGQMWSGYNLSDHADSGPISSEYAINAWEDQTDLTNIPAVPDGAIVWVHEQLFLSGANRKRCLVFSIPTLAATALVKVDIDTDPTSDGLMGGHVMIASPPESPSMWTEGEAVWLAWTHADIFPKFLASVYGNWIFLAVKLAEFESAGDTRTVYAVQPSSLCTHVKIVDGTGGSSYDAVAVLDNAASVGLQPVWAIWVSDSGGPGPDLPTDSIYMGIMVGIFDVGGDVRPAVLFRASERLYTVGEDSGALPVSGYVDEIDWQVGDFWISLASGTLSVQLSHANDVLDVWEDGISVGDFHILDFIANASFSFSIANAGGGRATVEGQLIGGPFVPTSDVATAPAANKILRADANGTSTYTPSGSGYEGLNVGVAASAPASLGKGGVYYDDTLDEFVGGD